MPLEIGGPIISVSTAPAVVTFGNQFLSSALANSGITSLQLVSIPQITVQTTPVTTLYIYGLLETLAGNLNCPPVAKFPATGQRYFNHGYYP